MCFVEGGKPESIESTSRSKAGTRNDHTGGRRELLHGAIPAPQNYWRNVIVSNKHEMNTRNIKKKEDRNFNVALNTQYRIVFKLSKKFQLKLISIP